jgi:hypothetical protein
LSNSPQGQHIFPALPTHSLLLYLSLDMLDMLF